MSIFTRFKDIAEADLDAILAKGDHPERTLRLMIQDMEDTLVEMKVSCAQSMADRARARRNAERFATDLARWSERAELALGKGREDMAREALLRRRETQAEAAKVEEGLRDIETRIHTSQDEIAKVEDKLLEARDKLRLLATRHETPPPPPAPPSGAAKAQADDDIEQELSRLREKLNANNNSNR